MPNNTLEKWEEKTLGEVCTITAGQSPESQFYNTEGNGLPFYQGKKEFTNKYIGAPTVWTTKITKEALAGDILMSVRAPVGPINYATQKCCIGRGLASIRKSEKISNDFLFYYLLSMQEEIGGHDGAVFNSISRNEIATLKIKLPLLSEQQRIVGILDEVFENIEKAKQNTLQNLNNAKELFESNVEQIFHYDCENIVSTTFSQEFKIKSGDFLSAQNMNLNGGYNVYGGNGINGKHDTYNYFGENIIIGRVGEKCGNIHYVNDDIWVTDNAFVLIDTEHSFDKRFLYYLLTKLNLRQYATKSTHPVISGKSLKDVVVSFPNNTEIQQKIVSQLDELQEQTKKLEQIYTQKLKDLDELKQSILQKAFNGEL